MEQMDAHTFSGYFGNIVASGLVAMSVALGTDLGLYDVLSSFDRPATSSEIAAKGKFQERYVREWLGVMVSAKIVVQEADEDTFYFPPQYRDAMFSKWTSLVLPAMGLRFGKLKECFRAKEIQGISWSAVPETFTWFDALRINGFNDEAARSILVQVPGLIPKLESGISVADVGCGTGWITNVMAKMFPNSSFHGFDSASIALKAAENYSTKAGVKNTSFHCHDVDKFSEKWIDTFDYVFIVDTVHDLPHPIESLVEMKKILKPSGHFSLLDVDASAKPSDNYGDIDAASLFAISTFVCLPSSACENGSELLGACWGREKAIQVAKDAGFTVEKVLVVPVQQMLHLVCTKKIVIRNKNGNIR